MCSMTAPSTSIDVCLQQHPGIVISNGRCALAKWSGRRLGRMVAVLHELDEPTHYSVIAERTNALLPPDQRTSVHNIHAHMQRRPDLFVRVGRGIFGLKEWGLPDDGGLANAAYRVLNEAGHPLHIEELTERVLEIWHARPSSVYTSIVSDERFLRVNASTYGLVEWRNEQPDS